MFRHNQKDEEVKVEAKPAAAAPMEAPKAESLEDLIRKNLKWSQIIYEQNRKINNKLLWTAIASWLYFILIVAPLIAAVIFLPPLLKNVWSEYADLLGSGTTQTTTNSSQSIIDNFMQLFNSNPAQQAQLKSLLK